MIRIDKVDTLNHLTSRVPRLTRDELSWVCFAAAVHLIFLLLVAQANQWSLEPLAAAHDGQYYITHLNDPLLLNPPDWENIPYRALRIGVVLLALPFRWLGAIPALATVNLVAIAIGTWAIRRVALQNGASQRIAALVWIFNPGALVATALLLPDTLAWAAILLTTLAMSSKKWGMAMGLGVLAVATKEASLVALGMLGIAGFESSRRSLLPVAAGGLWHLGLLALLTLRFGDSYHSVFIELPFTGWDDAWRIWIVGERWIALVVGLFFLAVAVVVLIAWLRRRSLILAAAAGHALLLAVLSGIVLAPMANTTRIGGLFLPALAATRREASSREDHPTDRLASDS